jgi:hypothetical protein
MTVARPFRLVYSDDGLTYTPWAAYRSLEGAQRGLEKAANPTDERDKRMNLLMGGWFVILNVGVTPRKVEQAVGIGRCKDTPMPQFRRTG